MSKKHIQTLGGHYTVSEIIANSSKENKSFKCTTLPYEHLIQNLSNFIKPNPSVIMENSEISLKNYSKIIKYPLSIYQNLHLEPDASNIANELEGLKRYNIALICDVTSEDDGLNRKVLREVQNLSKIPICCGHTIDIASIKNIDVYIKDLEYTIVYGKDLESLTFHPSFLKLSIDNSAEVIESKEKYNKIAVDIVDKYQIPLFVSLGRKLITEPNDGLIDVLNALQIKNRSKLVFACPLNDSYVLDDKIKETIRNNVGNLVCNDYCVVITLFDFDKGGDKMMDVPFNHWKAVFVKELITANKSKLSHLFLSNNLNYKIQLKKFGGFGYENLFENYLEIITKELTKEEKDAILFENLLSLLAFWEELKPIEKTAKYVTCENCGGKKDENDESVFRKFNKSYCSFQCLKEWLSKNKGKY